MRIISGNLKGKSIFFLKSKTTRPLKDSVKENIFNIIAHSNLINLNIKDCSILDLYSGIGSFGLECISRGAKKITFIEKDKNVAQTIKKNLENLKVYNKADVIVDDINNYLNMDLKDNFEIFFFDPPFKLDTYINQLKLIKDKKIFKKNHLVIIHREKKSNDNLDGILKKLLVKQYGRSKIIFGQFFI